MSFSNAGMVNEARRWIGFHEGPANRNPFSFWQYGQYYNPWCDSFVCYCAVIGGGYVFPAYSTWGKRGDMNVGSHHQHAIQQGIWRDKNQYHAQPGDLIVLSFTEADQHIEMAIADNGGNIATIGGNTADQVAFRTRYRSNVVGIIALTQDRSQAPAVVTTPKEIRDMGMTAACPIPGAKAQSRGVWKGRFPEVQAVLQANGTTDLVGGNGCSLEGGIAYLGMSILHLGKLVKPIGTISPVFVKSSLGNLKYSGKMVGIAADHGTFAVKTSVTYL